MRPDDTPAPTNPSQPAERSSDAGQEAVANIARHQLDSIYSGDPAPAKGEQTAAPHAHAIQAEQWKRYHSEWQNYYQKYYERYYVGAVHQVHAAYSSKVNELAATQPATAPAAPVEEAPLSQEEAIHDLRSRLLESVQTSTKKIRRSRHFVPLLSAVIVLLLFSFLQFNRIIIANVQAYVTPGEIDPQNIVVDPNASLKVSKEPRLIIPKINVNVPVDYGAKPDQDSQMKAMENGVAYFGIPGADSRPGQIGNTVVAGHSSNDFIDKGDYKFVFALLDRLKKGDTFYLNYNGTRYTYTVTRIRVVKPDDVSALVYKTSKPEATLLTCTPLGTALNRLLVTGEQVSPDPGAATAAPQVSGDTTDTVMPGNSPTIVERLFGA
jgi:sortase A